MLFLLIFSSLSNIIKLSEAYEVAKVGDQNDGIRPMHY